MHTSRFFYAACLGGLLMAFLMGGCTQAAKKARILKRAEADFAAGNYEKAQIEYISLLRMDAQDEIIFRHMGAIWMNRGAPLQAFPFLFRAKELDPKDLEVRLNLATAYLSIGQAVEGRKEALAVLDQAPGNEMALLLLSDAMRTDGDIAPTERRVQDFPNKDTVAYHLAMANVSVRKGEAAAAQAEVEKALVLDAKSAVAHLAMANLAVSRDDTARAGQEFKAAADLAPVRSPTRLRYAEFEMQSGARDEARHFLDDMVRQAPDYLPATLLLGQLDMMEKKYDDAQGRLAQVVDRDPKNPEALVLQARVFLAMGDVPKALAGLQSVNATYPNIPQVKFYLARAWLKDNNLALAAGALGQAVANKPNYTEAILLLAEVNLRSGNAQAVVNSMEDFLKKHPGSTQASLLLAGAYRNLGKLAESAEVFQRQVEVLPQSMEAHFMAGMALRRAQKPEEARAAFEKAHQLSPEDWLPIYQLVELDLEKKDFAGALARVEAQKHSATPSAQVLEGKIYMAKGDTALAETALHKALEYDPTSTSAYQLLISLYLSGQKLPEAVANLETLLAKNPTNTTGLMTLALISQSTKNPAKARDAYEKLLELKPDFAPALNNLACIYAESPDQLGKAYEIARKARAVEPDDASVADTLGWILYKRGEYQQAASLLQEAADKAPDSGELSYHVGMANYMMGLVAPARIALRRAAAAGDDFPGKKEIAGRLALLGDNVGTLPSKGDLEEIVKQQPNDVLAWSWLGDSHEAAGDHAKASSAYERALKLNPKLAGAALKLAVIYSGPLRDNEKALAMAKRARELSTGDAHTAGILGEVAYRSGNYGWAYSLLQEGAGDPEADSSLLYALAWCAYSMGKVDDARQTMERFLAAAPDSPNSSDAKSFLIITAPAPTPAEAVGLEAEAEKRLKKDENDVPALMIRGGKQREAGDVKAAMATYAAVLRRFPEFTPVQKSLAGLYVEDPELAGQAYELGLKARKALPDDPELAQIFAEVSYQRKDYAYARQLLLSSATVRPLTPKYLYILGMSHLQLKQKAETREVLGRALAGGLSDAQSAEVKRVLADLEWK